MKNILFLISFLSISCAASAQEIDSAWIFNRTGEFFQARKVVFATGAETTTIIPLGDTTNTVLSFTNQLENDALDFSRVAEYALQSRKNVTEKVRFYRFLPTILGRNLLDTIAKDEPDLYKTGHWRINQTPIRFRRTATNFQYRADTSATWRQMTFLGSVIRLNDFNGYTTDLYRTGRTGKVYKSINNQYDLRPISDVSSRIAAAPVQEEDPPALRKTILLGDGRLILEDGKIYKYNLRKKTWDLIK
jgi:hypothetical protein